jgi:predicted metalloprotease
MLPSMSFLTGVKATEPRRSSVKIEVQQDCFYGGSC